MNNSSSSLEAERCRLSIWKSRNYVTALLSQRRVLRVTPPPAMRFWFRFWLMDCCHLTLFRNDVISKMCNNDANINGFWIHIPKLLNSLAKPLKKCL